MRAVELLFTVVLRGARVDPIQALEVQALESARRLLAKHPDLQGLFQEVYDVEMMQTRVELEERDHS